MCTGLQLKVVISRSVVLCSEGLGWDAYLETFINLIFVVTFDGIPFSFQILNFPSSHCSSFSYTGEVAFSDTLDLKNLSKLSIFTNFRTCVQFKFTLVRCRCSPCWLTSVHNFSTAGLAEILIQVFTLEDYNLNTSSLSSCLYLLLSE